MSRLIQLSACTVLLAITSTAAAHHSAVSFDKSRTESVTGTVTKLIWRNPHVAMTIDVTDDSGNAEPWVIEFGPPSMLMRNGVQRQMISEGETVSVVVNPKKDGKPGGLMQGITFADGQSFGMEDSYSLTASEPENPMTTIKKPPSLTEYVPIEETWQEREARTRPDPLPRSTDLTTAGKIPGALDPEHLTKGWPEPAFDLTGTWAFRGEEKEQKHYGSYEFKPVPRLTSKAQKFFDDYVAAAEKGERFYEPTAYCYPAGMPRIMTRYGSLMMLQYPTAIFMVSRLNNEYRVIYLDGRKRRPQGEWDPNWNGESLGRWEGDTLVIETEGFTAENHIIQQGIKTGSQLKIVERYTMINDGNTIKMDFIMTDPEHWVGEWRHTKFRDRLLNADVREATCLPADNVDLLGE
jgi:hypothetical protein